MSENVSLVHVGSLHRSVKKEDVVSFHLMAWKLCSQLC